MTRPDHAILAASVRVPEHVVHRVFPAETVILNLETGRYHGLNPTGGRMLELLEGAGTVAEVAVQVAAEFGQPLETVQNDLCQLCTDLAKRGLIEIDGPAGAAIHAHHAEPPGARS